MITHVVLMKFKSENKARNMNEALDKLRAMVGRVPSLRELEVGLHAEPSSARAMDLALITRFDDVTGLHAYADDAVHVTVKDWLATVLEASYVVDFAGR
jgi:antibiotic biosynthesis monooxygenase (ABM) superfamily enzyme